MKKNWNLILAFAAIGAGVFLRVYKIFLNYYFTGELGKELLYIRQYALSHTLPLTGMATSHEWLSYGPFYYWFMMPVFNIFKGDPFILFWVAFGVSVIGLILNYFVFNKLAGEKIAMISTVIQSLSPLLIWQTRLSKLHVFFWVIMPVFTYLMYELWNGNKKVVFWTGVIFGILFSFHFSQIPILIVVALLFLLKKHIYKFKEWVVFAAGLILPNITLLWQDKSLLLWLPYRALNLSEKNPGGTGQSFLEFFGKNIFWDNRLWVIGFMTFVIMFINYIYRNRRSFRNNFLEFYLISSISIMLLANVLHGASPIHYYLPIFTIVPLLLAVYLEKFKFWYVVILAVTAINVASFLNDPLFYKENHKLDTATGMVPYYIQDDLTSFIVTNAKGKELKINRIGPYSYFPEQYSQNYKYLVLWKGGRINDSSRNVYTIVEDVNTLNINVQK